MDITIRIAGEAGQGVQTTGHLLVSALASMRIHVFATQSYMSRIRGGVNCFDVRIGQDELFAGKEQADLLVALSAEALETVGDDVSPQSVTLFDGPARDGIIALEFSKVAREVAGSTLMANSVAAGAVFAVLGYDLVSLCEYLAAEFKAKGDDVIQKNITCAEQGAKLCAGHKGLIAAPEGGSAPASVCSGTEAVGLAAATAGVKLASSYPMTPSTGVFQYLAGVADEYGIVVEQAEDEIAAINIVCGATYAGVPAMTTTSGGGFALMVEGLSLAGMLELPAFVMLGQRPGPATGLPTRTAQQDLKFAINAGHGEFARAAFAPGTCDQAYDLTRHCLQDLAHKFQTPAILLTDQFLADSQKNTQPLDATLRPIDRHIETDPAPDYVRYAITPDGISPRALPGSAGYVVCDSDEHTEDGHITENLQARVRLQDKRLRKASALLAEVLPPEWYGPEHAEHVLIAWGSTYGPCREAVDIVNAKGGSAAMLHFGQVWPIDAAAVRSLLNKHGRIEKITCVEGNSTGQFASVLREAGALDACELLLRYDGLPFVANEIVARVAP